MNQKFKDIDSYIREFPETTREKLESLRRLINEAAPLAEECISYNMPAFKQGKVLVYFAGYKHHIGFYPTSKPIVHFADKLKSYKFSKGAVQFPIETSLPKKLIQEMVRFRLEQVLSELPGKVKKK